jgi:N-acetylmuramoyl-L-alanine amidase
VKNHLIKRMGEYEMLTITKMLLTNHNKPGFKLLKLKGIVIHWTANESKGANALANRNYFNTTDRACSAHYIVDDKTILQCIPEDEVAYHVGATKYTPIGQSLIEHTCSPNYFLLGIEMCVNSDGTFAITYKNTVSLAAALLTKHNLSIKNLYRHYDITGKDCPKMLLEPASWNKFKAKVETELNKNSLTK